MKHKSLSMFLKATHRALTKMVSTQCFLASCLPVSNCFLHRHWGKHPSFPALLQKFSPEKIASPFPHVTILQQLEGIASNHNLLVAPLYSFTSYMRPFMIWLLPTSQALSLSTSSRLCSSPAEPLLLSWKHHIPGISNFFACASPST